MIPHETLVRDRNTEQGEEGGLERGVSIPVKCAIPFGSDRGRSQVQITSLTGQCQFPGLPVGWKQPLSVAYSSPPGSPGPFQGKAKQGKTGCVCVCLGSL